MALISKHILNYCQIRLRKPLLAISKSVLKSSTSPTRRSASVTKVGVPWCHEVFIRRPAYSRILGLRWQYTGNAHADN